VDRKKDGARHRVEEQELQDYLQQLDEIELEAARYFALSDEQFYWRPEPGRWSGGLNRDDGRLLRYFRT